MYVDRVWVVVMLVCLVVVAWATFAVVSGVYRAERQAENRINCAVYEICD